VDPVAAQLIQSETLSIQDIARILNLPPHLLGELSHATYSNIEEQNIQFVQLSLRPTVKRLEDELESKLFLGDDADRYSVKFNLDGLLRGNTKDRAQFYHNAILDGYMSRNEVRELEGFTHKDGLDEFLYPLNSGIVGKENDNDNK
jgi:HK97 family phage portal protein